MEQPSDAPIAIVGSSMFSLFLSLLLIALAPSAFTSRSSCESDRRCIICSHDLFARRRRADSGLSSALDTYKGKERTR